MVAVGWTSADGQAHRESDMLAAWVDDDSGTAELRDTRALVVGRVGSELMIHVTRTPVFGPKL